MLVLRGFQNTNLLVLLGGLLLCLVFMIQVKQIYNNNQKYSRYLGYNEYVRFEGNVDVRVNVCPLIVIDTLAR